MKKIALSLLICGMMLTLSAIPAFAADITTGEAVYGTPVIDGKVDEIWENAPVYPIDRLKDGVSTPLTAQFRTMWDEQYLYVFIEVNDADHSFNGGPSVGDGIEVYIDFNNTDEASFIDDGAAYFAMCADDSSYLSVDGSEFGKVYLDGAAEVCVTETETSYLYEVSIDFQYFLECSLEEELTIGFDIQVNDQASGSDARTGAYGLHPYP